MNNLVFNRFLKYLYTLFFTRFFQPVLLINYLIIILYFCFKLYFKTQITVESVAIGITFFFIQIFTSQYLNYKFETQEKEKILFQSLLNKLPVAICLSRNGEVTWVNEKLRLLLGSGNPSNLKEITEAFPEFPIIGKTIKEAITHSPSCKEILSSYIKCKIISGNLEENNFLAIIDTTHQTCLNNDETVFQSCINKLNLGIIITDSDEKIIFANTEAENFLGRNLVPHFVREIPEITKHTFAKNGGCYNVNKTEFFKKGYKIYKIEKQTIAMNKILNLCPFGIIVVNKNRKIMEFNQYIRKKIKSTNLASEPIYLEELIEPAQRNQFMQLLHPIIST